jgi:hypothetical protein
MKEVGNVWKEYSSKDIIAWLEKQGEQKPQGKLALEVWKDMRLEVYQQASGNRHEPNYSDDSTKMFSLTDIDEIFEKVAEKQCEQKANEIHPIFRVGDYIKNKNTSDKVVIEQLDVESEVYCYTSYDGAAVIHSDFPFSKQDEWELIGQRIVEQKPAWSGKDSCCYDDICEILINLIHSPKSNVNKDVVQRDLNWIMSISNRIKSQAKSAWSEEDEPQKELAETYLAVFDEKFPILPTLKGNQLADYKNFLNKCQQILGLKYWSLRPLQGKLFEKLSLLWADWGAEHLKGLGQTNGDTDNEKQEWSEEDENMLQKAISTIRYALSIPADKENDPCFAGSSTIAWLKSLKERMKGE